jgi:hypothetical protein
LKDSKGEFKVEDKDNLYNYALLLFDAYTNKSTVQNIEDSSVFETIKSDLSQQNKDDKITKVQADIKKITRK